jgi:hypothetical protein
LLKSIPTKKNFITSRKNLKMLKNRLKKQIHECGENVILKNNKKHLINIVVKK